jgi:divalent metal cation (Fe/Co/Zn/Cd) transporter
MVISIYEGIAHIRAPEPISRPWINVVVLGLAFAFKGFAWTLAAREFTRTKGDRSWWVALRRSTNPVTFIVLLEDTAAIIGIIVAAAAIGRAINLDRPALDGVGSAIINCLPGVVAIILAHESKMLLIAERADPALSAATRTIAGNEPGVCAVNEIITLHLAPDQIVVTSSLDFDDHLQTGAIEAAVIAIKKHVRAEHADVCSVLIRPQASSAR